MKNYKSSMYSATKAKLVYVLWNEELNSGVIYHTSTKTSNVIKIWLQFGNGKNLVRIPLDKNTSYEEAIEMLEQTHSIITNNK